MTEYYSFHDRWAIWSSGYFSAFLVNLCVCFYITMTWWIGKGKLYEDDKCGMVEIVKMNKMHSYDSRAGIRCAFSYVFCRRNWVERWSLQDFYFYVSQLMCKQFWKYKHWQLKCQCSSGSVVLVNHFQKIVNVSCSIFCFKRK